MAIRNILKNISCSSRSKWNGASMYAKAVVRIAVLPAHILAIYLYLHTLSAFNHSDFDSQFVKFSCFRPTSRYARYKYAFTPWKTFFPVSRMWYFMMDVPPPPTHTHTEYFYITCQLQWCRCFVLKPFAVFISLIIMAQFSRSFQGIKNDFVDKIFLCNFLTNHTPWPVYIHFQTT